MCLYLCINMLERELKELKFGYAKKPRNLPAELNAQEVQKIFMCMSGKYSLVTGILNGCGLRVHAALGLCIKNIDFVNKSIYIFRGKGENDRYTLLPQSLVEPIKSQITTVKKCHDKDICEGFGTVSLPLR
jgi:integrase